METCCPLCDKDIVDGKRKFCENGHVYHKLCFSVTKRLSSCIACKPISESLKKYLYSDVGVTGPTGAIGLMGSFWRNGRLVHPINSPRCEVIDPSADNCTFCYNNTCGKRKWCEDGHVYCEKCWIMILKKCTICKYNPPMSDDEKEYVYGYMFGIDWSTYIPSNEECMICKQEENCVSLKCHESHVGHPDCFDAWFASSKSRKCPICRLKLN